MPIPEEISTILREANTCAQSSEQVCYLAMHFYDLDLFMFWQKIPAYLRASVLENDTINVGLAVYIND